MPQPTSATVISAGFEPLERMNSARGTREVRCAAQTQDQHVLEAVHHNKHEARDINPLMAADLADIVSVPPSAGPGCNMCV